MEKQAALFRPGEPITVDKVIERLKIPGKHKITWWDIEYAMKGNPEYVNSPRKRQELADQLRLRGIHLDGMPASVTMKRFEKWVVENCKFAQQ